MFVKSQKYYSISAIILVLSIIGFILTIFSKIFLDSSLIPDLGGYFVLIGLGSLFSCFFFAMENFKKVDTIRKFEIEFFKKTFCFNCVQKISPEDTYCQHCGNKLK